MKHSNSTVAEAKKLAHKKTALDNFQLFYEEIPLELEKHNTQSKIGSRDRLVRRSKRK